MLHCMTCQWGGSRVPWVWPEVLEKTSPPCQGCCRPWVKALSFPSQSPCYMLSLFHAGSSWFHSLMSVNSEIAKENSLQKYVNLPKISRNEQDEFALHPLSGHIFFFFFPKWVFLSLNVLLYVLATKTWPMDSLLPGPGVLATLSVSPKSLLTIFPPPFYLYLVEEFSTVFTLTPKVA